MTEVQSAQVLSSSVLVLNRSCLAVHVISVRRAFVLLYREIAEVIDIEEGRYANYNFRDWCEASLYRWLENSPHHDWVRTVSLEIQVPRVVRLLSYDRAPRGSLRFNRRNLFARDAHQCQYCGGTFGSDELSVDHVLPRSRGGPTQWDNVVSACVRCNTHKGGRTPQEARMRLRTHPAEPRTNPILAMKLSNPKYECWRAFLPASGATVEVC